MLVEDGYKFDPLHCVGRGLATNDVECTQKAEMPVAQETRRMVWNRILSREDHGFGVRGRPRVSVCVMCAQACTCMRACVCVCVCVCMRARVCLCRYFEPLSRFVRGVGTSGGGGVD